MELGDGKQARELLEERTLPLLKRFYGEEHIHVISALYDLAHAYGALGNAGRQREIIEEQVLPVYRSFYVEGHINVALALHALANAYGALGDAGRKRELLEQVLVIYVRHYGESHALTGGVRNELRALASNVAARSALTLAPRDLQRATLLEPLRSTSTREVASDHHVVARAEATDETPLLSRQRNSADRPADRNGTCCCFM